MLDRTASKKALITLFRRRPIVDLNTLCCALNTTSRMSVFRRLKETSYLSSYTHRGGCYTLTDIPQFDDYVLWFNQGGVGFSRAGTLKATLVELIDSIDGGYTHRELEQVLRIRVHNTLVRLIRDHRIGREHIEKVYLYVRAEPERAATQVAKRRERMAAAAEMIELPDITVIEVLLEVVRAGKINIAPIVVVERLHVRGVPVTTGQVELVFVRYGIEKKRRVRA